MKCAIIAVIAFKLFGLASAGEPHDDQIAHARLHDTRREASLEPPSTSGSTSVCHSNNTGCMSAGGVYAPWYGEATLPPGSATSEPSSLHILTSSNRTHVPGDKNRLQQASPSVPRDDTSAQAVIGGSLYAMAYTPYKTENSHTHCASAAEVSVDIASIAAKGFTAVRTYATDCHGLEHVANACRASGLTMIVGIFVDEGGLDSADVAEQIIDIKTYFKGDYSIVDMVLLGNEVLFHNWASGTQLAAALSGLRSELRAAGYNGPVSTADTVAGLEENQGVLCEDLDVLAANIHPFFNDAVSADEAGPFALGQLNVLKTLCGGAKQVINSETGWPSRGEVHGAAIPGREEQEIAIASIKRAVGGRSVFSSFEDDHWKGAGHLGVDSSWGCGHVFPG